MKDKNSTSSLTNKNLQDRKRNRRLDSDVDQALVYLGQKRWQLVVAQFDRIIQTVLIELVVELFGVVGAVLPQVLQILNKLLGSQRTIVLNVLLVQLQHVGIDLSVGYFLLEPIGIVGRRNVSAGYWQSHLVHVDLFASRGCFEQHLKQTYGVLLVHFVFEVVRKDLLLFFLFFSNKQIRKLVKFYSIWE